jgi:anti-sigma factor RsiW
MGTISERDLHAYVDGLLDEGRCMAVEAYLVERPAEAARVADYKRQNRLLRGLGRKAVQNPYVKRKVTMSRL